METKTKTQSQRKSRNRKERGRSLSNHDRREICEKYLDQQPMNKISEQYGVHKSTITRIVKRFIDTDSHESKPKGGRVSHKKLQDQQLDDVAAFYHSSKEAPTLRDVRNFCQERFNVQLSLGTAFNTIKKIKGRTVDLTPQDDEEGPFEMYNVDELL